MKITSTDIFITKEGQFFPGKHQMLFIRINTDEGIYGFGETIVIGRGIPAIHTLLKLYSKSLIGEDPFNTEKIWQRLHGISTGDPITVSAYSAIDIALWDIKGKALNVPVYKLLGGKVRDKIEVYLSHIEFGWPDTDKHLYTADDYFNCAKAAKEAGYNAIKTNFIRMPSTPTGGWTSIGPYTRFTRAMLEEVEERVAAVREALGEDGEIILENNAVTGVDAAVQIANVTEKHNIWFYEEPVTVDYPEEMKQVADRINIPIATGERLCARWGFLPFLENHSTAIVQPDLCNTGGITEGKKIADLADIYHAGVALHVCGGPFAHAASVQLEAVIPNFVTHEHHVTYLSKYNEIYGKYKYDAKDGYVEIPELPGLGQDLSEEAEHELDKITIS